MTDPRCPQRRWALVFEDHFTGKRRPEWRAKLWFPGVINHEQQSYVADALVQTPDRLVIETMSVPTPTWWDSNLVLPYRSGLIHTHGTFAVTSGIVEARIKLPAGKGVWSALWLLAEDKTLPSPKPEIDIFENLNGERALHLNYHNGAQPASPHTVPVQWDLTAGYHVYTCAWDANGIEYYLDGALIGATSGPIYPGPYHLIINTAVGGWAGTPQPILDTEMWIDYVRVWA